MNPQIDNNQDNQNSYIPPEEKLNPTISPIAAAFIALAVVFILYQVGGSVLTLLVFGFDIENADVNAMRLMTVGGQILFILLPALMFAKLVYEDVTTIIRVKLPNLKEVIVFIIGLVILTPLLQSYLYIQNFVIDLIASKVTVLSKLKEMLDKLDEVVTQAYADLLSGTSIFEVFFVVIVVAVVPSLCEEVFFRGYVQKSFELRIKPFWAALITAVFFGMYHFNPYGLPALIALGLFFGFAAYKSNSIVIPLMLHFLNNLIAIIAYYILGEEEFIQGNVKDPSAIGTNLFLFIFFLALFLVYIYLLIRNYHKINRS